VNSQLPLADFAFLAADFAFFAADFAFLAADFAFLAADYAFFAAAPVHQIGLGHSKAGLFQCPHNVAAHGHA
jgi:hypothetical protein